MHPVKAIAIGLLAWPAAEFIAFLCVAATVGFVNAIVLIVLMSVAGFYVLRHFGSSAQRIETGSGFIAASVWRGGTAPGLGGILLLIPGFLTSVLGIVVLFPLSRRWLLAGFRRLFAAPRQRPGAPDVIDLAPNEWGSLPADKLPPTKPASKK
jgi:UPF0716 protein FxsA